jgi:phosphatidylglycerophosphatase A
MDAPVRPLDRLALVIATLGPAGRMPKAPGTWGSLAATLAAPWCFLPLPLSGRLAVLGGVLAVGTWASGRASRVMGREDPGCVVVDELLGQWTAFAPFFLAGWDTRTPWELLGLFALFRLFDIAKPWPIRAIDRGVRGGLGIMLDDLLAGVFAAAALALIRLIV